jgi:hypothetical protein
MPSLSKVGSEMLDGALPALDGSSLTGVGVDGVTSSADATAITIDSSERVGIGTGTPTQGSLVVAGTGNQVALNATSGQDGSLAFYEAGTGRFFVKTSNGANNLRFVDGDNSTERMRINGSTGSLEPKFGIKFPATQVASADANTLDDYEEGDWTPAWIPSGGSWAGTFNGARYVKIGRMVWVAFTFSASGAATGSKMNGCNGLPFTSANAGARPVPSIALSKCGLADHELSCRVAVNNTSIDMGMSDEGTAAGAEFLPAHTASDSQFSLTLCYEASA